MKIFSIPNYQINNRHQNTYYSPTFGLRIQEPLKTDTVSFGIKRTIKTSNIANMANNDVVSQAIQEIHEPHKKLKELLEEEFGDLACDKNKFGKQLITIGERIKGIFSARQKTGSRNWSSRDEILQGMTDLSGHCIILEERRAFTECMNRFIKLIKSGKIIIAKTEEINADEIKGLPVEYHVIPPKYRRGKIVESHDSLSPQKLQELKKTLIDVYNPSYKMSDTVDSISGYSGLHVIVKTHGGHFSEIKFLTRAMADVQHVENMLYKIRNGKTLPDKYSYIETILAELKPLPEYASDKERKEYEKLSKAISKYTLEVYKDALKHPYTKDAIFPKPSDPHIAKYDFNKLKKLIEACENM